MILLIGDGGQVGRELARSLSLLAPIAIATRTGVSSSGAPCNRIELAQHQLLEAELERISPRIIVNAAAYTAVDRAEDEAELARAINHRAVGVLAGWAARNDALLVQYSTDYIFAGDAWIPYDEDAKPGPLSAYGRSKWAGEEAVRASGCDHLIFRTAWIYAAHGHNFLRTILRAAHAGRHLRVVQDQLGVPTSARFIAGATAIVLSRLLLSSRVGVKETLHLACRGTVSWHGFAKRILTRAVAFGLIPHAPDVVAIDSDAWPTRAVRPRYSVLDCSRIAARYGIRAPSWEDELDATLLELTSGHQLFRDR